jgi:hypothetical protein
VFVLCQLLLNDGGRERRWPRLRCILLQPDRHPNRESFDTFTEV